MKFSYKTCARKGFTLIEVLIVIALLAILFTLSWMAMGYIEKRKLVKTAETQIERLAQGVEAYQGDQAGLLPYAKGDEYSSHTLYQILFSDYDNDGEPDRDRKDGQHLPVYCDELAVYADASVKEEIQGIPAFKMSVSIPVHAKKQGVKKGKKFVIVDPWENPYRFCLGHSAQCEDDTKTNEGPGINPNFDIFSQGADMKGNGKSKEDDNADNISNVKAW